MTRYIDADSLREYWLHNGKNERVYNTNDFLDSIDEQPSADVQPVVHAHWIEHKLTKGGSLFECSNCEEEFEFEAGTPQSSCYYYCPYCSAKMDGDEHDNG